MNFIQVICQKFSTKRESFCLVITVFFVAQTACTLNAISQDSVGNNVENPPFADIHLHYNWDQEEIITASSVLDKLRQENVVLGVVSSIPSENALKLSQIAGDWIIPLFSPYITQTHRHSWYLDEKVVELAREGLSSRKYFGIGELHLWSGMPPRADNKILIELFELAKQYDVPMLLHTEASDEKFIIPICQQHKHVRILWAHAGGILKPASIENVIIQCPNIWVELSARDPWRYNTLVDESGKLPLAWTELLIKYQDKFMTGSDPVWSVTKTQRWNESDEGWDHLPELLDFHRQWLSALPEEVELKIRLNNAIQFFHPKSLK